MLSFHKGKTFRDEYKVFNTLTSITVCEFRRFLLFELSNGCQVTK